jgi:single-strand DNA-binding protein
MKGFAKAQIMGNLVRDPEVKTTASGKTITSFTVAVNTKGNADGVDFLKCIAWEKTGELIAQYFQKGKPILVDGYIVPQTWEKDGEKRTSTEIQVRDFYFIGGDRKESGPISQNQVLEKSGDFVVQDIDDTKIDLSSIPFS